MLVPEVLMFVGELCNREVVVINRQEPIREAVRLMRKHHVGDVVVVETVQGHRRPVGILTDRDIVIELLAAGIDLDAVATGDAMSYELLTARESDELLETLGRMRARGVRRVPIVDDVGNLVGILTLDDLIELTADQFSSMAGLVAHERDREVRLRP
jgi:CBS domain-containing protein